MMIISTSSKPELEKRTEERSQLQLSVKIRSLDRQNRELYDATIVEVGDAGATLLTHIPLPVGTRLEIYLNGFCPATAEVTNWQWDYRSDISRLGVRFISANNNWPLLYA
jgi:hypothetical protein